MNTLTKRIAKNTFYNFLHKTTRFISNLILSVITARLLGPDNFGNYALIGFTLAVAELMTDLGLSMVNSKYISEFSGNNNKEIRASIFMHTIKIKLIALSIVTLLLIIFSKNYADFYSNSNLKVYIIISAICLLPTGIANAFHGAIIGLQEYKYLSYRTIIVSSLNIFISFVILKMGYGIIGLLLVNVFIGFVEFFFYFGIINTKFRYLMNPSLHIPLVIKKKIYKYNWHVALILFLDAIVWQRSEVFFLGKFCKPSEIAYYSLAYGIIEKALVFLPSIFTGVLMPAVSELYGKGDNDRIQKLYVNSTRYILIILMPIFTSLMIISKPSVNLLYGSAYLPVSQILNILLISGSFGIIGSIGSSIQYGTENQGYILKWGSLIAIGNIILDFTLIPKFGAIGAAIANAAAQVSGVLVGTNVVCKLLSVKFPFRDLLKVIISSLAMIPVMILTIILCKSSVVGILLSITFGVAIYFLITIILKVLNKNDADVLFEIRNRLPKVLNKPMDLIIKYTGDK